MKRILPAMALIALLAGCGSAVKLDEVAVEDKTGTPISGQGSGAASSASGTAGQPANSAIVPLDLSKSGSTAANPSGQRIVYFDYDSFAIKPEFQDVIEAQARFIKSDKNRRVSIEGHTDDRGGREYNLALGQKRAEAVRRALGLLGAPDAQLEAVSFGKEKPAVQGNDENAMARNRRAEISYR